MSVINDLLVGLAINLFNIFRAINLFTLFNEGKYICKTEKAPDRSLLEIFFKSQSALTASNITDSLP